MGTVEWMANYQVDLAIKKGAFSSQSKCVTPQLSTFASPRSGPSCCVKANVVITTRSAAIDLKEAFASCQDDLQHQNPKLDTSDTQRLPFTRFPSPDPTYRAHPKTTQPAGACPPCRPRAGAPAAPRLPENTAWHRKAGTPWRFEVGRDPHLKEKKEETKNLLGGGRRNLEYIQKTKNKLSTEYQQL